MERRDLLKGPGLPYIENGLEIGQSQRRYEGRVESGNDYFQPSSL